MNRSGCLLVAIAMMLGVSSGAHAELPASVGYVEAASLPIRVYYNKAGNLTFAQALLTELEDSWELQVGTLGLPAPMTVDDAEAPVEGLRFYVLTTTGFAGYTVDMAAVDATAATDCATITLVSDALNTTFLRMIGLHEVHHAIQHSVDCIESAFAYDQTAMALTTLLIPQEPLFATMLPTFQAAPERAIDFIDETGRYRFGSSLFSYFLETTYGAGDGQLLADIWKASPQDGNVVVNNDGSISADVSNSPNLLDAMKSVLSVKGVSFADAFVRFSTSRYFIGALDDGAHIAGASDWTGSEPFEDAHYALGELPVGDAEPQRQLEELGTSFIVFDVAGARSDASLELEFAGAEGPEWRAVALAVPALGAATEIPIALDASRKGKAMIAGVGSFERVVLVAVNLGTSAHVPDVYPTPRASFVYGAALVVCPALTLTAAEPNLLTPGMPATMHLTGSGFPEGQEIAVALSGAGVNVTRALRLSATELELSVTVEATAPAGARDVTLSLACGASVTGSDLFVVDAQKSASDVEEDGGCSASVGNLGAALLCVALLALCVGRRRARHVSSVG